MYFSRILWYNFLYIFINERKIFVRIEKYLVQCGVGSRRDEKNLSVKEVKVNGTTVFDESFSINEENDIVTFDDKNKKENFKILYTIQKAGMLHQLLIKKNPVVKSPSSSMDR